VDLKTKSVDGQVVAQEEGAQQSAQVLGCAVQRVAYRRGPRRSIASDAEKRPAESVRQIRRLPTDGVR
jgi:hypothetical protein